MFSSKIKSFRDETSAWYNYLALLWAIGLGIIPFAEKYIFGGERTYFFAFCGFMILLSLLFAGWTSFKLRAVIDRDRLYYGFRRLEKTIIYKVDSHGTKYTLQYIDKVKATVDQRMLYPIRYKWSGSGIEGVPRLKDKNQQLVAVVGKNGKPRPYITNKQHSPGSEWHYYFVALSPPAHKNGEVITIDYIQDFRTNGKQRPGPFVNCLVIGAMEKLTLEARLPTKPVSVKVYHFKPFSHKAEGAQDGMDLLDSINDHVVRWTIANPKNGYRYQIEWTI